MYMLCDCCDSAICSCNKFHIDKFRNCNNVMASHFKSQIMSLIQRTRGTKALQFIEQMTKNCDKVQEGVLAEILRRNGETEYVKRHCLQGRVDRETFKNRVPIVTYEDIQPDIRRVADGNSSPILTVNPISEFLSSSGTSGGERKLIPTTDEDFERRDLFHGLLMPVIESCYPGLDKGKSLCFLFTKSATKTPGGLVAQPSFTSFYKKSLFKYNGLDPYMSYTSPTESVLCLDSFQSMYSQMLCGLYERRHVLQIRALFASGLLRAISFLHLYYNDICQDIATGTLSPKITDPLIQRAMSKVMKPDLDLARVIEQACSKENWEEGIIQKIWPNTKYLDMIVTGTMAQYIPTIDYYSGGLPIVSSSYRSAECYMGLNLSPVTDPYEVAYTIMPNMAYFEFMPLDSSSSNPALVDLSKVEIGKEYELVITTYTGLYRYRMGDVLRATGFHNAAPEFQFVRRKNVLLSIDSDKTNEEEIQKAVDNASLLLREHSNATIVEYTSCADTKTIPGHYVIYMELMISGSVDGRHPSEELLRRCCLEMEESLNAVYRQCRVADGSLGPLEIRIVRPGTFEEVMDYAVARGTSMNTYKVPRCISFLPIVDILDKGVVSAHFSPALPRWTPGV